MGEISCALTHARQAAGTVGGGADEPEPEPEPGPAAAAMLPADVAVGVVMPSAPGESPLDTECGASGLY